MKQLLVVVFLLLSGCGAYAERQQSVRHAETYIADKKPLAERGELKWSEYYKGLYQFFVWADAPGDVLSRVNDLSRVAQDYEAGYITKDDFDYRRRAAEAENRSAGQARAQQQSAAQLALAAQILQASGPRVLAPVAQADYNWAWDLQRSSNGGLIWVCRGIQSGQYSDQNQCAFKLQSDTTWPGY